MSWNKTAITTKTFNSSNIKNLLNTIMSPYNTTEILEVSRL